MIDRFADPRFVVTILVIVLFGWAYGENASDDTMKGALIAAFAGAWGFWLGSSRGATDSGERTNKALDIAIAAQAAPTAPQPVVVTNPPDNPVPIEEAR